MIGFRGGRIQSDLISVLWLLSLELVAVRCLPGFVPGCISHLGIEVVDEQHFFDGQSFELAVVEIKQPDFTHELVRH